MMTDKRMRGSAATIRQRVGLALFAGGVLALAWAVAVVLTGGMTLHAGRVTLASRDAVRPLVIAAVLLLLARAQLGGAAFRHAFDRWIGLPDRRAGRAAAIAAIATFVFTVAWSTRAAGGSDSSCYALQAEAFAHGHATLPPAIAALPPVIPPEALAPGGFIPSRRWRDRAVPICGPGLALAMA